MADNNLKNFDVKIFHQNHCFTPIFSYFGSDIYKCRAHPEGNPLKKTKTPSGKRIYSFHNNFVSFLPKTAYF